MFFKKMNILLQMESDDGRAPIPPTKNPEEKE